MNPRTRRAALYAIGVIAILASANALAHSYAGLYDWAIHHRLSGWQAKSWPAEIDVFLAVGELALYVAYLDGWPARQRIWPWTTALTGLTVSIAGNIGHIQPEPGHPVILADRLTAATSPIAAFAGLSVGLLVLKMTRQRTPPQCRNRASSRPSCSPRRHDGHRHGRECAAGRQPSSRLSAGQARWPGTATAGGRGRDCCAMPVPSTGMPPRGVSGSASGPWLGSCAATATGSPTSICA